MKEKDYKKLSAIWMAGEMIPGIKFRYNSLVQVRLDDGKKANGWIVGVEPKEPEPIYTIEIQNGHPCTELPESRIESEITQE